MVVCCRMAAVHSVHGPAPGPAIPIAADQVTEPMLGAVHAPRVAATRETRLTE